MRALFLYSAKRVAADERPGTAGRNELAVLTKKVGRTVRRALQRAGKSHDELKPSRTR